MATISTQEQYIKKEVLSKCWQYLNDNFHKFSDTNKIKISLELSKKDMPTQLVGDLGTGTKVIIVKDKLGTNSRSTPVSEEVPGLSS